MSEEDKEKVKIEILESYFEVETVKDESGNDVKNYKFNPSRRPTYEETRYLYNTTTDSLEKALAEYIKLEDMGKGQYSQGIEVSRHTVPRYAEMVDKMTTREEVLDFIKNKVVYKSYALPYDKILKKFPEDKGIKDELLVASSL